MALRQGNPEQMQMLPPSIEQYIPEDAPVRIYDVFGDTLDLNELGIEYKPNREGNPAYNPRPSDLCLFLRCAQFTQNRTRDPL